MLSKVTGCSIRSTGRLIWSIEQDVAVYANSELVARRDLDRWLYVQVAPGDRCAGLAHLTTNRRARGIGHARIRQGALCVPLRKIEGSRKSASQGGEAEQALIVMVHVRTEPRVAVSVESDHTVDVHGRGIRKNDPVPSHLHAILSV